MFPRGDILRSATPEYGKETSYYRVVWVAQTVTGQITRNDFKNLLDMAYGKKFLILASLWIWGGCTIDKKRFFLMRLYDKCICKSLVKCALCLALKRSLWPIDSVQLVIVEIVWVVIKCLFNFLSLSFVSLLCVTTELG